MTTVKEFTVSEKEKIRKQLSFVYTIKRLSKGSPEYIEYVIQHAGCFTPAMLKYNGDWFDFNYFLCDEHYDRLKANTTMSVLCTMIHIHAESLLKLVEDLY